MDLSIYYCLFMLTCFGTPRKDIILQLSCPLTCQCYYASADGIGGSKAESFICEDLAFLRLASFNTKLINTFVMKTGEFYKDDYYINKRYQTISVVLERFQNTQLAAPTHSIFNLFDSKTLKYLTILSSLFQESEVQPSLSNFLIDWSSLGLFGALEVIYIENCFISFVDASFSSINLNGLQTLVIRSSSLEAIDRDALNGKPNLRKLIISENELRNWNWLTSQHRHPLTRLWHLDLSSNHLTTIPVSLKSILPNLRVLYLAHNRLRYFSYVAMLPLFDLDEFQPTKIKEKKSADDLTRDLQNYIYYNDDLEKIVLFAEQIRAEFMVESLTNEIFFVCGPVAGTASWKDFPGSCQSHKEDPQWNTLYKYFPDNLRIDKDGQLETLIENADYKPSKMFIEGVDYQKFPISSDKTTFYFDSTSDSIKYRLNRELLFEQLASISAISSWNAIRLNLFSQIGLDFFMGKKTMTTEHIELIIDLVVEVLDEAKEKQCYILLIMWNYDSYLVQQIKESRQDYENTSGRTFEKLIIEPLMERISFHSALIGIEIINQFLSNENVVLENKNGVQYDRCDPSYLTTVIPQMLFLGYNAEAIKLRSDHKLVGLSIDSHCKDCLQLSLIQTCRQKIQNFMAENGFDFITFVVSETINVAQQSYHYSNWKAQDYVWFHQTDVNTNTLTSSKFRAVFFVLSDTVNDPNFSTTIKAVGSGYFIVNQNEINGISK